MFQRVLWVSLTQALRSVALFLLPTAFLALLAWSTAGSSNGNTSDPIRTALWIWLAAHHLPFHLVIPPAAARGALSYLPLGALIFPFLAARSGYSRILDHEEIQDRSLALARLLFAFFYSLLVTLIAWGASTSAVAPILYAAPLLSAPLIWFAAGTARKRSARKFYPWLQISFRLIGLLVGASCLALATALFFHLHTVESLTVVLQPGLLGGIFFLLFNLLYLPNAAVATLAYFAGPGFAIGANTLLSPFSYKISEIPALPILAALPTGRHPLALLGALVIMSAGALLYNWSIALGWKTLSLGYLTLVAGLGLLGYLSSGALLTAAMGKVGVLPERFALAIAVEIGLGVLLAAVIPKVFLFIKRLGQR